MKATLNLIILCCGGMFNHAVDAAASAREVREWRKCAKEAVASFDVPLVVLTLIYEMEGGRLGAETPNLDKNGTVQSHDIGPMQINSQHLPVLSKYGITRSMLRDQMCVNVGVAAWMVRGLMNKHARVADVVARYHSPTPKHQATYLARATSIVERRMRDLSVTPAE